jgi:hypothetical protein
MYQPTASDDIAITISSISMKAPLFIPVYQMLMVLVKQKRWTTNFNTGSPAVQTKGWPLRPERLGVVYK